MHFLCSAFTSCCLLLHWGQCLCKWQFQDVYLLKYWSILNSKNIKQVLPINQCDTLKDYTAHYSVGVSCFFALYVILETNDPLFLFIWVNSFPMSATASFSSFILSFFITLSCTSHLASSLETRIPSFPDCLAVGRNHVNVGRFTLNQGMLAPILVSLSSLAFTSHSGLSFETIISPSLSPWKLR